MKFKWMMLAVFLVCLFAISAVGAADNATNDTGLAEKTVDEAVIDNGIIDDSDSDMKSAGDSLEISDFPDDELKGADVNLTVEHKKVMTKYDRLDVSLSEWHGIISILVDGKEVYHDDYFWFKSFSLEDLYLEGDYGNHTLEVKYLGNQYNPTSYNSTFYYSYVDLYADSDGYINIDSEEEMSAKLYLDGDLIYDGKIDEYTTVSSKKLYLGYIPNYTIVTSGKGKYKSITLTGALDYRVSPEIDVPSTVGKGDDKYIKVTLPPDANGNLKVYLNDIDVNASFENGKSVISLNGLDIGDYNVRIVYDSDIKYGSYDGDYYHVKVTYNPHFKITIPSVAYLTDSTVTFTGSKDVEGKISIYVDWSDKIFKGDYKNGIAKIKIFDEHSGPKTYSYKFEGTYNGEKFEYNGEFKVTLTLLTVSLPKTVYAGHSFKATFIGPQSMNGFLDTSYGEYGTDVRDGKATLTIKSLKAGVKTIKYDFTDSKGNIFYSSFKVNVIKPPVIKANDFKKMYSSKKVYQIRIKDGNGKYVGAGKKVKFVFYPSIIYDFDLVNRKPITKISKTDKNGYVKADFNLKPGEYKVKIKYKTETVTKKYIVNCIIKVNEIINPNLKKTGKASVTAKKFVFGATLKKVDGKYLAGKKVKMTFYRQYYKGKLNHHYYGKLSKMKTVTLKTNKKGIAKIIYKNLPFKVTKNQLEGETILVALTYLKETRWVNLQVYSLSPKIYYFS